MNKGIDDSENVFRVWIVGALGGDHAQDVELLRIIPAGYLELKSNILGRAIDAPIPLKFGD